MPIKSLILFVGQIKKFHVTMTRYNIFYSRSFYNSVEEAKYNFDQFLTMSKLFCKKFFFISKRFTSKFTCMLISRIFIFDKLLVAYFQIYGLQSCWKPTPGDFFSLKKMIWSYIQHNRRYWNASASFSNQIFYLMERDKRIGKSSEWRWRCLRTLNGKIRSEIKE